VITINIQIKRGNKETLPQLKTGEPAITLDEQRLYIGGNDNTNIPLPNQNDINNIKNNEVFTLLFVINSSLTIGAQPLLIRSPNNGIITDINAIIPTVSDSDIEINIEKTTENDFETNGNSFTSILDNNVKILSGKLTNKSAPIYTLSNNVVNKGDIFRLNIINNGNVSGLSLQISIKNN